MRCQESRKLRGSDRERSRWTERDRARAISKPRVLEERARDRGGLE